MYRDCEGRNKTLFVHRWHDYLCRKFKRINNNNKNPLLELISDYSKVARYKVSIQKSVSSYIPSVNKQNFVEKHNNIYISIFKSKILRHESKKICTRTIWGKTIRWKKQRFHVHG